MGFFKKGKEIGGSNFPEAKGNRFEPLEKMVDDPLPHRLDGVG